MAPHMTQISTLLLLLAFFAASAPAQIPEWIWHPNGGAAPEDGEVRYFRKTFSIPDKPSKASLLATGDDEIAVWINGEKVIDGKGWNEPKSADVTGKMVRGENTFAIRGRNEGGDAALLARLELTLADGKKQTVVTDASWSAAASEEPNWSARTFVTGPNWTAARSRGKLGIPPWGDVIRSKEATPVEELTLLPGFRAELLWSAQPGEGSWICMTTDDKGRLIISPQQDDLPFWRVTLSPDGKITKKETIPAPLRQAMGLLYAHGSLYVNGHGPSGTGLYRLIDENKNDQFDANEVHFLKKISGEGEHGYHGLALGPDKMIYMMNGNHTRVPENISDTSPHKNYQEDLVLPRQWDANGHAVGVMAPGGYIVRTDAEGKKWELLLGGFRNSYDFDFNADGEIFTFDSDMEWDWGLPWYRPTRIYHSVLGGEYGWRSGSGKWPDYYADSLTAAVDIGIGSPTGVKFGTKGKFPEKYRKALFAMDWSYGRLLAVHLQPDGATYKGSSEVFVKGKPLNVTDLDFGYDGAMYFTTGGRGTQSGLYRVTHPGEIQEPKKTLQELALERDAKTARELRHKLELFAGKTDPAAVEFAWPHLRSDDRWIRYAARIAIESQPVAQWHDRALSETNVNAALTAAIALARVGGKETQRDLLLALRKFPVASLSESQKLEKLRAIELSFIRQGKPDPEIARMAMEKLDQYYPASTVPLNRELCQLLVYLEAPEVAAKTLALLDQAKTQGEQITYIFALRTLKSGWTMDQRRKYFSWFKSRTSGPHPEELLRWFKDADRDYSDGASFTKFLANIRNDAMATLTETERAELGDLLTDKKPEVTAKAPARERKIVKEWTMADVEPSLNGVGSGRNFESGKAAFTDTQCFACHRFGDAGGSAGPELTAASSKYTRRDILDSILEPSKIVSEQYQNFSVTKKDGDELIGRIVDETDAKLAMQLNPFTADRTDVKKSDIASRKAARLSPMPEGLINNLSKEEILDLLAYIESAGKANAANFR